MSESKPPRTDAHQTGLNETEASGTDPSDTPPDLMALWGEVEALFPARHVMLPTRSWSLGLSRYIGAGRLSKLMAGKAARALEARLADTPDERLIALRALADINHRQTTTAFRTMMVANITAPVLFLSVVNFLVPGGLGSWLGDLYAEPEGPYILLVYFLILIAGMLGIIAYASASLSQSRDLLHLIDLHAAKRGITFGDNAVE